MCNIEIQTCCFVYSSSEVSTRFYRNHATKNFIHDLVCWKSFCIDQMMISKYKFAVIRLRYSSKSNHLIHISMQISFLIIKTSLISKLHGILRLNYIKCEFFFWYSTLYLILIKKKKSLYGGYLIIYA